MATEVRPKRGLWFYLPRARRRVPRVGMTPDRFRRGFGSPRRHPGRAMGHRGIRARGAPSPPQPFDPHVAGVGHPDLEPVDRALEPNVAPLDPGQQRVDEEAPPSHRRASPAGSIPAQRLPLGDGAVSVDVAGYSTDPDGEALTYAARSSRVGVVSAVVSGNVVTLTPVAAGTAAVTVTATDPGGLSAAQSFRVTVASAPTPFTDDPVRPGVTPIRAIHFTELRERINALRTAAGLPRFAWTDPGPAGGGDAGQARASSGAARGARRGVCASGSGGAVLDRCGAGGRGDPDQGGAPDGAARRRDSAGVKRQRKRIRRRAFRRVPPPAPQADPPSV